MAMSESMQPVSVTTMSEYMQPVSDTTCHYLRAEKCVTAIHIGLKTSNDLYTCFKRKANQLRTRGLQFWKELGTYIGCLFVLRPKYVVSSRD